VIKDPDLSAAAQALANSNLSAEETRKRIRAELERRYILAA